MRQQITRVAVFAAAALSVVGCVDLSGPPSGLASISPIQLAWPSVVAGDVLRDEGGALAPLRVEAYDGDGELVTDATVSFIVLAPGVRVDPDGVVHGETVGTRARIVAQVRRGGDVLQTPEDTIDVVPRPDSVTPTRDTTFAAKPIPVANPAPIPSEPLTVRVLSRAAGGPAVRSWIVRYEILTQPPGVNDQNTAVFPGGGSARVAFDTTDANGAASLTISLQRALLVSGTGRQDVTVRATIPRIGASPETRAVVFTLPFVGQ